jgi:hypothetical protein
LYGYATSHFEKQLELEERNNMLKITLDFTIKDKAKFDEQY